MQNARPAPFPYRELVFFLDGILWAGLILAMLTGLLWPVVLMKGLMVVETLVVLGIARKVAEVSSTSFRGQRAIGAVLLVLAHAMMLMPPPLPIVCVAVVLVATPLSGFLLFD